MRNIVVYRTAGVCTLYFQIKGISATVVYCFMSPDMTLCHNMETVYDIMALKFSNGMTTINSGTSQGVLGHLPKRKLPPHLLLRSQASTPVPRVGSSRVRKSNKASPPNRPK